jgi:uncharacterized membrane protein
MADKASVHVIARTLFWFRWGAASTVLFGLLLLWIEAQDYASAGGLRYYFANGMQGLAISMGVLLALVMAFNVWAVIWPRQKKILSNNKAIAASTDDAEKKRLADENAPLVKTATLASRMNTWFSVPMLWGMVFGAHGYGDNTLRAWYMPMAILAVVLLVMWSYSSMKPKAAK